MIEAGKRVAWNHDFFRYPPEAVIYTDTIDALHPPHHEDADARAKYGTVVGPLNESGSLLVVQLDGEDEPRELTCDELVQVKEREAV